MILLRHAVVRAQQHVRALVGWYVTHPARRGGGIGCDQGIETCGLHLEANRVFPIKRLAVQGPRSELLIQPGIGRGGIALEPCFEGLFERPCVCKWLPIGLVDEMLARQCGILPGERIKQHPLKLCPRCTGEFKAIQFPEGGEDSGCVHLQDELLEPLHVSHVGQPIPTFGISELSNDLLPVAGSGPPILAAGPIIPGSG